MVKNRDDNDNAVMAKITNKDVVTETIMNVNVIKTNSTTYLNENE